MQIVYFTEDMIEKVINNLKSAGIPEQDRIDPFGSGFVARICGDEESQQKPCIAISTDYFLRIYGGELSIDGFEHGSFV